MQYKLRNVFTKVPDLALKAILKDRGVKDLDGFLHPSSQCELNPYDLDNIRFAAERLLEHLHKNSNILFVVD